MIPDLAEFECGCYIRITSGPPAVSLWQCSAGDKCVGWQLILAELTRCMSQIRIHVLGRSL